MDKSALSALLTDHRRLLFALPRLRTILAWMALLTLWLATRPYHGIWHDSQLYSVQALRLLNPEAYTRDLFFLYGSQDDYTLFSPLYAQIIRWLGLDQAALVLTILGQALWLLGAAALARRLLPVPWHWLGLGLVIVLNDYYGHYVFSYGESFVTPRLYAEALCMLGMSGLLQDRFWWALLAFVIAFLLHPLMAIGAGFVAFFWWLIRCPFITLVIACTGLLAIGLLVWFDIAPFSNLVLRMSDAWYDVADARSAHLFLHNWDISNWNRIVLTFALLMLVWRSDSVPFRSMALATMLAMVCGLMLAGLGGELWRSVLLIQLQLWRVLWFATLLSAFAAAWVIWDIRRREQRDWIPLLGFVSAWLLRDSSGGL